MSKPRLTVGLLNWKRPDNLRSLIYALRSQTEPVEIFLWNNSPESLRGAAAVNWRVDSSINKVCMPRWWMLQQATTQYVTSFDDDLLPADSKFVENLLQVMDSRAHDLQIVGAFGITLAKDVPYEQCTESLPGGLCDIVLGRQLCLDREALNLVELPYKDPRWGACDDIALSGLLRLTLRHRLHKIPTIEMPADHGLCQRPEHYAEREAARKEFFPCTM